MPTSVQESKRRSVSTSPGSRTRKNSIPTAISRTMVAANVCTVKPPATFHMSSLMNRNVANSSSSGRERETSPTSPVSSWKTRTTDQRTIGTRPKLVTR